MHFVKGSQAANIDCHILNFIALTVVGVLQYYLFPLPLCNLICDGLWSQLFCCIY